VRALFARQTREALVPRLEAAGVAFAPIARPEDLFDDPHLSQGGGLVDLELENGTRTRLPALPVEMDGQRPHGTRGLPSAGGDTAAILQGIGLDAEAIETLRVRGVIGVAAA
jgi:crotonobetainyl-CoA:carnitine CoA-transferase CaiB-like acyl-CoA transferase